MKKWGKNIVKKFVLLGMQLLWINAVFSQTSNFHPITVEDGLPNNSVISIAQDQQGFIWMGTTIGLCKYDGTSFKLYKNAANDSNTLTGNHIISLHTDKRGRLWAGTSNGLNVYNLKYDRFERINQNIIKGTVYTIYEDSRGWLWVGTKLGLFRSITGNYQNLQPFSIPSFNNQIVTPNVRVIKEDSNGNIWIGAVNGLTQIQLKKSSSAAEVITYKPEPAAAGNETENYITAIEEDNQKRLWLGTQSSGVFLFDPTSLKHQQFKIGSTPISMVHNNIRSIKKDNKGQLWIGAQEGLTVVQPQNMTFNNYQHNAKVPTSLSQNSVYCFLQDNNGSMWVGTYFGGANISYPYTQLFSVIQNNEKVNSLSNNVISSIVEDENHNFWIGTEGGGLNYYNSRTQSFQVYKASKIKGTIGSNLIKIVYKDKEGNIWVGTHHGGLNVLPKGTQQFQRYDFSKLPSLGFEAEVSSIVEDSQNRLWVALNYELKVFEKNGIVLTEITSSVLPGFNNIIRYLYKDNQGVIWLSGIDGTYTFEGGKVKLIDDSKSVNVFAQDKKGIIWMGLNNNGLAKYNPNTKKIEPAVHNNFLNSLNILGIITEDDGSLWMSSNNGILHFYPETGLFNVFTKRDGISGNEFNYNSYLKDNEGKLYFGGFNGITTFSPSDVHTNNFVAPIRFTSILLNNKPVGINDSTRLLKENIVNTKKITFNYTQKVFTINFAILNYIKTDKNKYFYKLEGLDNDWIATPTGSATFNNLSSGSYTLSVKALNNDGVWGTPVHLNIVVLPPFWLTWWAYTIYLAVFILILTLVIRYFFLRALLKKEENMHQAKLNFFTNISHEIRTHLSLITTPIERLTLSTSGNDYWQQQLSGVKTNAQRLLKLVNELMDFRKMETNHLQLNIGTYNIVAVVKAAVENFQEISLSKNIQIAFHYISPEIEAAVDEAQIEKVMMNLLSNAFKFTPSGGKIKVNISTIDNKVIITVEDNGIGIAPYYLNQIFTNYFQVADYGNQNTGYGIGLALSKGIVELHAGSITVKSKQATDYQQGETVFTITLPQKQSVSKTTVIGNSGFPVPHTIKLERPFYKEEEIAENTAPDIAKKYTVLIADDHKELLDLIAGSLSPSYHIIKAKNGVEAWNTAIEEIPDLIISDVMMPEMDGYQLCSKLKTDERTNHIPVILLTARSTENDSISGFKKGADMYITKPFSIQTLMLNIHNLLTTSENLKIKINKGISEVQHKEKSITKAKTENSETQNEFIQILTTIIEENIDRSDFGVDVLAKKVAMSTPVLYKKLRALTSMSVNEFIKKVKLRKAAEMLLENKMTVSEVAFNVGYNDSKYFSREFKKVYGSFPSEYKN